MKEILDLMLKDLENAHHLFKPTNFWNKGMKDIMNDLNRDESFHDFRSHKSAQVMYVPIYKHSFYKKYKKTIDSIFHIKNSGESIPESEGLYALFNGFTIAKSDYRTFQATETKAYPDLSMVSESLIGQPDEYFVFDSKNFSRSFLNYLLGLNFLKNNVDTSKLKSVFEIGGGYGTLGEILLKSNEDIFYLNVDIPPVAAVSTYYLSNVFGHDKVLSYEESRNMEVIDIDELKKKYKCVILCPWQLPKLKGKFDLFANFISFQEMEPDVVANYIKYVEKHTENYVLLRNSLSGKNIAMGENDLGVVEQTDTNSMYNMFNDFSLVNRDHVVYGFYSRNFVSEIACLSRNKI